jgi:hypothetical protein
MCILGNLEGNQNPSTYIPLTPQAKKGGKIKQEKDVWVRKE